jgi:uncharacterized protein YjbJ (UPF0337 family)
MFQARLAGQLGSDSDEGIDDMSAENKANNKMTEMKGKAKKTVGRVTDDRDLEAEGRVEQSEGSLKQAAEKVKDAFKK